MPNRVIRDSILTSRQVARLDWFQQALFVRLILGCDDYGRYYGAPDIICGHLFSTSSGVTQELVAEGLGKLEEEGLIVTYQVEEETYCALPQWSKYQVCRTRREKFPPPPTEVPVQEPKIFTPQFHEAKQASIETAPEAKSAPNPIQSESEIESQSEAESESKGPAGQEAAEAAAKEIFSDYGRICVSSLPCRNLTRERRRKLRELAARGYTPQVFREAFRKAQESVFLREKKRQRVNFDWFLEEQTLTRLLEGAYDDSPAVPVPRIPGAAQMGTLERESIARMLAEAAAAPVASPGDASLRGRAALD